MSGCYFPSLENLRIFFPEPHGSRWSGRGKLRGPKFYPHGPWGGGTKATMITGCTGWNGGITNLSTYGNTKGLEALEASLGMRDLSLAGGKHLLCWRGVLALARI